MPVAPPKELKIGSIVEETLGVLERCAAPALIFVAVVTLLNVAAAYFGLEYTAVGQELAKGAFSLVVGIAGAYFLFEAVLGRTGFRSPQAEDAFLPYVGLAILYTLGVGIGFILIIIPGLILMARWSVAQPMLIVRGKGVMQALKDSWERTRGNEFSILIAMLALLGLPIAASIAAGLMFEREDPVGMVVSQLASSATSAIGIAMGVALYGLIVAGRSPTAAATEGPRLGA